MSPRRPFSPHTTTPSVDTPTFRAALGRFATGVTIVTTYDAAHQAPVGLTANSFNSVSLDPPLVLWSLSKQAGSMLAFAQSTHYAINVLSAKQQNLAEQFAARIPNRFANVAWHAGQTGAPVLEQCVAVFECANRSRYEEGDHVIFVGTVEHCAHPSDLPPLLFHGGRFYTETPL